MKERWRMMLLLLVGMGLISAGFSPVNGQEVEEVTSEESGFIIEEIVVTAERRSENINDVPLTITAFDAGLIEEFGMVDEQDLEALTPGLQFGNEDEKSGQGTVIRGIGTRASGAQHMDMAVATYVDGVYSHSGISVAPNLFDIERVEVARGPQGTLNGKNSIAGSISYVTKKPTAEWDAQILGEFTNQTTQRYNVAFGGTIYGPAMFRLTVGSYQGDGAQKNIGHGGDYDAPDEISYSPQLRFKWDRVDVNLRYALTEDTGVPRTSLSLFDPPRDKPWNCEHTSNGYGFPADAFNHVTAGNLTGEINGIPYVCEGTAEAPTNIWYKYLELSPAVSDCGGVIANLCDNLKNKVNFNRTGVSNTTRESWTVNVDIDITDGLLLQYTYGENTTDQYTSRDLDLTNQIAPAVPGGVFDDRRNISPFYSDDASHEIQLVSNYDSEVNFILGYFQHDGTNDWAVSADEFSNSWINHNNEGCPAVFPGSWADYEGTNWSCAEGSDHLQRWYFGTASGSETRAYFGHVSYDFDDQWSVSGGLRHTEDTKFRLVQFTYWTKLQSFLGENGDVPVVLIGDWTEKPGQVLGADPRPSWDHLIWNVGVEYRPVEDAMVYGRVSTGYRAGGFNDSSNFNPEIKKETLINYELGVKGLFLEQRLNMRAASFFQAYEDYQVVAVMDPGLSVCSAGNNTNCIEPTASSPLLEYTTNIPDTKIWGFEVDATYYITERLKAGGFYTFLGSEIGAFSALTVADPDAELARWDYTDEESGDPAVGLYTQPKVWTGGTLPQQAKHKMAATLSYENSFDQIPGSFRWSGWLSYTGERYPYTQNIESQKMRAHKRLDVRTTWMSPSEQMTVTGFIQNITGEVGLVAYLPNNSGVLYPPMGTLTDPRRVGVVVEWKM